MLSLVRTALLPTVFLLPAGRAYVRPGSDGLSTSSGLLSGFATNLSGARLSRSCRLSTELLAMATSRRRRQWLL